MSMSLIKRSLALAALLMGVASGPAYAQDVVDVKVPFDFQVNGQTFHAGTYEVTINAASEGIMSLSGDHGKAFAFVFTIPASGRDPAGEQPALVFNRHENRYVLSQIWENGTQGRVVTQG